MERKRSAELWLLRATAGIRFGPDRRAVKAELQAHLEDRREALLRRRPGLSGEDAERLVLERMGDPEELGRALARIHRPWLGWLWLASRCALGLLALVLIVNGVFSNDYRQSQGGSPVWGGYRAEEYVRPLELRPEEARLGGYAFRIVEAVYAEVSGLPGRSGRIEVTFRAASPRFWARINGNAVRDALTVVTEDGTRFVEEGGRLWEETPPDRRGAFWMELCRWGPFSRDFTAYLYTADPWQDGRRVELEFDFGKGSFSLSAQVVRQEAEP